MRIFYMLRTELYSPSLCANWTMIDASRQTAGPRDELLFMTCMRNDAELSCETWIGLYDSIAKVKSNVDYIIPEYTVEKNINKFVTLR